MTARTGDDEFAAEVLRTLNRKLDAAGLRIVPKVPTQAMIDAAIDMPRVPGEGIYDYIGREIEHAIASAPPISFVVAGNQDPDPDFDERPASTGAHNG